MMSKTTVVPKAPVTPNRVATALARSCLIFQRVMRLQENADIFHEKGLSRHPYSVLVTNMALL